MHDHGDNKRGSWMMWMMAICCGLPLLLLAVFAIGGKSLGVSTPSILVWVGLMLVFHLVMMRHRKGSLKEHGGKNAGHEHHDCCHHS